LLGFHVMRMKMSSEILHCSAASRRVSNPLLYHQLDECCNAFRTIASKSGQHRSRPALVSTNLVNKPKPQTPAPNDAAVRQSSGISSERQGVYKAAFGRRTLISQLHQKDVPSPARSVALPREHRH
jgi:hypothetical protein